MSGKKILMVSLVPFWHRQTGAQQRMFALVQALQSSQHQVKTFFPMSGFECDSELIQKYSLDVEQPTPDQPPEGAMPKAAWYFRAIFNELQTVLRALPYPVRRPAVRTHGMKLVDYHWPWARVAFQQTIDRYQPDVIICQYVTTAWLLDGLSQSQRHDIHCIIDTHDLLSARNEQFEQRGHGHWIDISREEESSVLAKFDTVIAIQHAEAALMRAMAPDTRVIVAGHQAVGCEIVRRKETAESSDVKFSLGYIGSVNASNFDAIEGFLEQVWPRVAKDGSIELVVAGAICETIAEKVAQLNLDTAGRVRLLGRVNNVVDFYQEIDAAINPVQFGTGLKVKTVEALSHGIPVLTTEPLADNRGEPSAGIIYCKSLAELADKVEWLLADDKQLYERLQSAALEIAIGSGNQCGQAVYQQLLDEIARWQA
jgi:glycosyltransferase involved in cell wall biosynthesis